MTTATATTEGQEDRTGTDTGVEEGRTPTDNILTGQEGDEAADPKEVEDAIAAGFARAKGDATADNGNTADEEDITDQVLNQRTEQGDDNREDDPGEADANANKQQQADDDPEIPGLGMKASEVRAMREQMQTMQKSLASTSGHLGHLKQLVQQAGQGKKVTAEQLSRVSEEFGAEFASALADDLNAAGFGGGSAVDATSIQQMVNEQVQAARVATQREFEKKLVLRAHPDAEDHFAKPKLDEQGNPVMQKDKDGNDVPMWEAGPKHAAFMAFVRTLPAQRQEELFGPGGWDSSVVGRALDDFKAQEKKAANQQATQQQRINRAAVPNKGRGGEAQQPATDPVLQGWNNVRGRRAAGPGSAGGRGR